MFAPTPALKNTSSTRDNPSRMGEVKKSGLKILLIRFSSFGDVAQCLSVPPRLKKLRLNNTATSAENSSDIEPEIHWVVRADLAALLKNHPDINQTWSLDKSTGWSGLWTLMQALKKENFTHIYDAHNNLRSHLITFFLRWSSALHIRPRQDSRPKLLRKSQKRWKRFLLFQLRTNTYQMPFNGQRDLLEPLQKWGLEISAPPTPQIFTDRMALESISQKLREQNIKSFVVLAPSAAHALKRWPLEHWKQLIANFAQNDFHFIVIGGREDVFLEELEGASFRVRNWAGQTNFSETIALISQSLALVSNDTGALHVGEQLGHPTIALMGPAPFGFPSRPSTRILERDLACRPCSKHGQGPCVKENTELYHECLRDISPDLVSKNLREMLSL